MRAVQTKDRPIEHQYEIAMELERVLATSSFSGAPVMSRLLRYLAGELLAGRGKQLKAYTVAVDALGRSPDFDPLVDSYPRVQIGRLRKMLEAHYARHATANAPCLFLRRGSYEMGFARLERAYPDLAKHVVDAADLAPEPVTPSPAPAAVQPIQLSVNLPKSVCLALALAGLGLASAAVALIVYLLTR